MHICHGVIRTYMFELQIHNQIAITIKKFATDSQILFFLICESVAEKLTLKFFYFKVKLDLETNSPLSKIFTKYVPFSKLEPFKFSVTLTVLFSY